MQTNLSANLGELSVWAPELAQTSVSLSSDIALVMGHQGVIQNVAQGAQEPLAPGANEWIGRFWADTATWETRAKIEQLLKEVGDTGIARKREINHALPTGANIVAVYTAIRPVASASMICWPQ